MDFLGEHRQHQQLSMLCRIRNDLVAINSYPYITPLICPTRKCHVQGYIIPQSSTDCHKYSFPRTVRLEWHHWQHSFSTVTGSFQGKAVTDVQDSLPSNSHCRAVPWTDAVGAYIFQCTCTDMFTHLYIYIYKYILFLTTTIACTPHSST